MSEKIITKERKKAAALRKNPKNYAKPVPKKPGGGYYRTKDQTKLNEGTVVGMIPIELKIKKVGRPTKYKKQYCQDILDYFTSSQPVAKIVDDPGGKGGTQTRFETMYIPTIRGFAASIGVTHKTLYEWTTLHVEFLNAFERACAIQDAIVEQLGLAGRLGKGLAELYFMNRLEYRDARSIDLTTDGAPLPTPITALQLNVNNPQAQALPPTTE